MKKRKMPLPDPFSSIKEMMRMAYEKAPDNVAYMYRVSPESDETVSITYREFFETTENIGAALTKRGFGSAHIACVGENSYPWIVTYLTVLKSAGVFVPIDKDLCTEDMLNLLNNSDAEVLFYAAKFEPWIREHRKKMPAVKLFVGFGREENDGEFLSFSLLAKEGEELSKEEYDSLSRDENEMMMLVYTSGTTGVAKGVMLTEHNIVSGVYYGMQVSHIYDRGLSVLPYHHTYEAVCDILVAIHTRATLCINQSLKSVLKDLQLYKPTYIYLVPAFAESFYNNIMRNVEKKGKTKQLNQLIRLSRGLLKVGIDNRRRFFHAFHETFGGRLKKIVCGGAPIRPEISRFFTDIGIPLTGGYGITECSPLVCVNDERDNNCQTAGHRLACLEWRIDEPGEGGIGEICVKGDVVMKGYYKDPVRTAEVIRDGWFYTGDYGYITSDDALVITGRKKNIIVLNNGKNIYPEEIERHIGARVGYILEVVVRGIKNAFGQETGLSAEVYTEEEKSKEEVLKDVRHSLADLPPYKSIAKIILRKKPFAKTTSQKIKRQDTEGTDVAEETETAKPAGEEEAVSQEDK